MVNIPYTLAESPDGTLQITFTVPKTAIREEEKKVVAKLAKETTVAGFRKGMAPLDKVRDNLPKDKLIQDILAGIIPSALSLAISEKKLRPAIYPKLELISASQDQDWQVRATTCNLPKVELGAYKEAILKEAKTKDIWVPGKDTKPEKSKSTEDKQNLVIRTILATTKVTIPAIIIQEEVNSRLAKLLERTEKLGLTIESYLASIGKTYQSIRQDYEDSARESLTLELALNQIAEKEKVTVTQEKINQAITSASTDPKLAQELQKPEQHRFLKAILMRQEALQKLVNLV